MKFNKQQFIVSLCLVIGLSVIISAFTTTTTKPSQGGHKNLQVLPKDISDDSLDMIMDGFKAALNVRCNFCHKWNDAEKKMDFASDEKPEKLIARHMMRMTMDINAKYFNFDSSSRPDTIQVVTCNTCHRGIPQPDAEGIAEQMQQFKQPGKE